MAKWIDPATQFESLYEAERSHVLGFLTNLVPREAEDLMQETFLRAFRAKDRFVPRVPPGAWLITIARNNAISFLRAKRNTEVALLDGVVAADDAYAQVEDRALIHSLTQGLTRAESAALGYRYAEDLTLRAMSAREHVSLRTLNARLTEAIAKMREAAA